MINGPGCDILIVYAVVRCGTLALGARRHLVK
jgi:hypothetical protein